jgi:hypothetical protein
MKLFILAATGVALVAAAPTRPSAFKDRAAMILYEGRDHVVSVIPYADSANLTLILLRQMEGDAVKPEQLAGRSCIGVALFSTYEWAQATRFGRKPADAQPGEASMRMRVYPSTPTAPPVVQDVVTGAAWVSVALQMAAESPAAPPPPKSEPVGEKPLGPGTARAAPLPQTGLAASSEAFKQTINKWSVKLRADSAKGPCTVQ